MSKRAARPIASVSKVWFWIILYPACMSFLSSARLKSVVFLFTAEATPISPSVKTALTFIIKMNNMVFLKTLIMSWSY